MDNKSFLSKYISWFVSVAFVFLWVGPVTAGVFKWVDKEGKTHYTNDMGKIPRQYRNQGKVQSLRSPSVGNQKPAKAEEQPGEDESKANEEKPSDSGKLEEPLSNKGHASEVPIEPAPEIDPEVQAKLKEVTGVIDYLNIDNTRLKNLLKEYKKQDRMEGEYVAWSNKREAKRSKKLAEQIYESGYSELEPMATHLWDRAEAAEKMKINDSKEFEKLVPELFRGLKEDLAKQQQFVDDLDHLVKDLGGKLEKK